MALIDSNVIIYAAQPQYDDLRRFIDEVKPSVSVVSYIETLGYHRLGEVERQFLEQFFQETEMLPLSDTVIRQAVRLHQQRRMGLGDVIVAATAMVHDLTLVTRNIQDFRWIGELRLLDPLTEAPR